MNPEEIKVGEIYKLELLCILNKENVIIFETPTGYYIPLRSSDFEALSPANGTKSAEKEAIFPTIKKLATLPQNFPRPDPDPKYDPCRLFKKGDEVEYRPKDGRANPNLLVGRRYKVAADEPCDSGIVQVEFDGLRHLDTFVAYNNIKLVTPVEALEPHFFICDEFEQLPYYCIYFGTKNNHELVSRLDKKYYTLEAAEAERDRLNAEHRKEQE